MAQIFVSGKIGPLWGKSAGYEGIDLAVVDLEGDGQVFHYSQQILTYRAHHPQGVKSFVMDMAFMSIYHQYMGKIND